jgi:hypothetical protein
MQQARGPNAWKEDRDEASYSSGIPGAFDTFFQRGKSNITKHINTLKPKYP